MDNHHFYLRWVLQHPYGVEVGGQTTMSDDMLLVHVADYVLGAVREEFAAMHDQVDPWPDHFHLLFKPPEGWPDYYPPENMG